MDTELGRINNELKKGNREIHKSIRGLEGLADRIMHAIAPEMYKDYQPSKRTHL